MVVSVFLKILLIGRCLCLSSVVSLSGHITFFNLMFYPPDRIWNDFPFLLFRVTFDSIDNDLWVSTHPRGQGNLSVSNVWPPTAECGGINEQVLEGAAISGCLCKWELNSVPGLDNHGVNPRSLPSSLSPWPPRHPTLLPSNCTSSTTHRLRPTVSYKFNHCPKYRRDWIHINSAQLPYHTSSVFFFVFFFLFPLLNFFLY